MTSCDGLAVSAWLALVAVQLGPCGVRLVREARGDAVTDSRVTPQAVEAAERALVASTSPWPITDELWEKVKRTLGPNGTSSRREIELFLTAAAPLLCQPLQDEIDRLRAVVESVESLHSSDGYARPTCYGCGRLWPCETRTRMTAAVPVGTGNPPTFEEMLADPTEQFDTQSEVLPKVLDYLNAPVDAKLCDDDGIVRGGPMWDGTDYPCTGSAHFAGDVLRCTTPVHGPPSNWVGTGNPTQPRADD